MTKIFITFCLLTSFSLAFAQNAARSNSVYAELAGNGLFYSLGYEKVLISKSKDVLAARIGICLYPVSVPSERAVFKTLPVEIVSRGIHKNVEVGIGITPFSHFFYHVVNPDDHDIEQSLAYWVLGRVGYRSTPGKRGLFWSAAFTPKLYDSTRDKYKIYWFGAAIGKNF